jgi:nucleotide-binding universal stress UspA family protein
MMNFTRILHPTEFGRSSLAAFNVACSMAKLTNCTLNVLHVFPPEARRAPGRVVDEAIQREQRRKAGELARERGVEVDWDYCVGEPVEEILEKAAAERAELIVMGLDGDVESHGRLLSVIAEPVRRRARCPVAMVYDPGKTA